MKISYKTSTPDAEQFYALFQTTGWNDEYDFSKEDLHKAITKSWYVVAAYYNEELIGFGRMISDGVYQTFIGDMIVHPDYKHQKIGTNIMDELLTHCKKEDISGFNLRVLVVKEDSMKNSGLRQDQQMLQVCSFIYRNHSSLILFRTRVVTNIPVLCIPSIRNPADS